MHQQSPSESEENAFEHAPKCLKYLLQKGANTKSTKKSWQIDTEYTVSGLKYRNTSDSLGTSQSYLGIFQLYCWSKKPGLNLCHADVEYHPIL